MNIWSIKSSYYTMDAFFLSYFYTVSQKSSPKYLYSLLNCSLVNVMIWQRYKDLFQSNCTICWFAGTVFWCWLGYSVLTHVSIFQNLIWSNITARKPLKSKGWHALLKTWNNEKNTTSSFFLPFPLQTEEQYYRDASLKFSLVVLRIIQKML